MSVKSKGIFVVNLIVLFIFSLLASPLLGQESEKIKGISLVGSNEPISDVHVKPIIEVNANWVTLMPYGFVGKEGKVQFNSEWQWWGEREEGVKKTIELCRNANLKIMLKPQIWMMNAYTGDYKLTTEAAWIKFEQSYEKFIMAFLAIAETYNIELFCIGTEWREFIKARPLFWTNLIKKTRTNYKGEITYAANWDDYQAVPFWKSVDFIGVNGYFPISLSKKPALKELQKGWEIHKVSLAGFAKKYDQQIIFTEIGYRSMTGGTIKPWEHHTRDAYSAEVQNMAYQALFQSIWKEKWFKGMFIWKWYHNHSSSGGKGDIDFTPQNKPALETIKNFWEVTE